MNIFKRLISKTPKRFRNIRNIGLLMIGISGLISSSTISLPLFITNLSGYLALIGGIISLISQFQVEKESNQVQ